MYNVTQEVKDLFKSVGSIKRGYLSVIPLSDEEAEIIDESKLEYFEILDDIYTPKSGIIGSVIAKQISIQFYKETSLVNREVEAYIGVEDNEHNVTYVPYGTFIIQKPETNDLTDKCSAEGLDYMVKFNLSYQDTLEYPCTVKDVLNSICTQCEVELGTDTFTNSEFVVENNQFVGGESCRDVLRAIAQISGTFARIGRDNKLYLTLSNDTDEQIINSDYGDDIKINNTFGGCNRVVLKLSAAESENVSMQDDEDIALNGVKEISIADNPFTYTQEKRTQAISELWDKLRGFTYTDYSFTAWKTKPYMDAGDSFTLIDKEGNSIPTYLFTHNITFNGGLKGTMSAESMTETENKYVFTPEMYVAQKHTEIIVDKHEQRITEIAEQVGENTTNIAEQQITINNISSSVKLLGGNNKQRNSIGAYGTSEYEQSQEGTIIATEEELLKTTTDNGFGRIIYIGSQKWFKFKSESLVIGDTYTLSLKYSNTADNHCEINFINNNTTNLVDTTEEEDLEKVEYTFVANTEFVELEVSTGQGVVGITDYYLQTGEVANKWQPASGEALSTVLSIYYNGIEVTSASSEIVTKISNLGFSVTNNLGKVLITFNKDKCILSDTEIVGMLEQKASSSDTSSWKRYTQTINGYVHFLEVYN